MKRLQKKDSIALVIFAIFIFLCGFYAASELTSHCSRLFDYAVSLEKENNRIRNILKERSYKID